MAIIGPTTKPVDPYADEIAKREREDAERKAADAAKLGATAPPEAKDDTAFKIGKLDVSNAQLDQVMKQFPLFKILFNLFKGIHGGAAGGPNQAFNAAFEDITRDAMVVTADEKAKGYREIKSSADLSHNLKMELQEKFDKGQLTFGKTPEENKAGLERLKAEVDGLVKDNKKGLTSYDTPALAAGMTKLVKEFHGHINLGAYPDAQPKVKGDLIAYGQKIEIDTANMSKAGVLKPMDLHTLDSQGNLHSLDENIRPTGLNSALGEGPVSLQTVEQNGHRIGYFASNKNGEGYYLASDAVDLSKIAPDLKNELAKPEMELVPLPDVEHGPAGPVPYVAATVRPSLGVPS